MAASLIPSSWVLADLFDVTALELLTPDHVHESAPELAYVPCSACGGQGWNKIPEHPVGRRRDH